MNISASKLAALAFATALLFAPSRAQAQVTEEPGAAIFPDPAKFARGLFVEGEAGVVTFFGEARQAIGTGFGVGTRVGYDFARWLALQAHLAGSTHETKLDGTPQSGQLLQLYQATAELKATIRIVQTSIFLEGGAGASRLSTNILATTGLTRWRTGLTAGGGAGIDYHSLSRHFSIGLRGGFFWLRDIAGSTDLSVTSYVRYTF